MCKKYIIVGLLLLIVLIYIGYVQKDIDIYHYTFSGENDDWKASFRVDSVGRFTYKDNGSLSYQSRTKKKLVVAYKGMLSDLTSVRHLEISYIAGSTGGKLTSDNDDVGALDSRIFILQSGDNGYTFFDENEIVEVTINLNEQIQTLDLKYMKNNGTYLCPPGIKIYF